ncbi:futalosine hydrolase [Paenibacillus bovis]|uniref:Futalosine hydrolase n=1 Tax=Paenibacillus bovis TaxID=1616788 RepID=A0A172ZDU0_9BACL|nr:futalosine hydrolase [Paenibacillus bovis]ANF95824.1 futalosine hydrolase [Paenibacillus bovis]
MEASSLNNTLSNRILIMTAVEAEREAVQRGLGDTAGQRFDVQLAGVGPASAAARTALLLARGSYDLVISAGIGGGFEPHAAPGSIVLSDRIIAADLGSGTPEHGFISVDELGFGSSIILPDTAYLDRLTSVMRDAGLTVHTGPVLTVSTTTGSAETTAALIQRIPDASAEGMEGFGVAEAARLMDVPVLEIRAISNKVGPRDRDSWRIPEALKALTLASSLLPEVL